MIENCDNNCDDVEEKMDDDENVNDNIEEICDAVGNKNEAPEIAEIRVWAVTCNISIKHLDILLNILRKRLLPQLPKSRKTFLETIKASYNIRPMHAADNTVGEFVYLGIKPCLTSCVNADIHMSNTVHLQANVDGASPYDSGSKQLWPILCKIIFEPDIYEPFIVAIYYGNSKPHDINEFMKDFIEEINILQRDGIDIMNKHFSVTLEHIICDIPARKFLKQIKGHGGFAACERCEVYGRSATTKNNSRRVIYPDTDCNKRTNESFRLQQQKEHHTGFSPLLNIQPPINIITSFTLDYMHLCCLGVTKKFYILNLLFNKSSVKLNTQNRTKLFKRILYLIPFIPDEFQRKIRIPVPNLKASELRFIALYAGPVLFKGILSSKLYDHFLLFHTAFRILCTKGSAQTFNELASSYLKLFFLLIPEYYGEEMQTLNTHYLLHLADDVKNNNYTLNDISAFPFENKLRLIKQMLRTANKPLAQICRRIYEQHYVTDRPIIPKQFKIIKVRKIDNNKELIIKLSYKNKILTTKPPNDIIMLSDSTIVKLTNLGYTSENEDEVQLTALKWMPKKPIFNYPTNSAYLGMWQLNKKTSSDIIQFKLQNIVQKMILMRIPYKKKNLNFEKIYVMPLIH